MTLPPDGTAGRQVNLHYHLADFWHTLDNLRNERPMYLLFIVVLGGFGNGIKTQESVGEGEA